MLLLLINKHLLLKGQIKQIMKTNDKFNSGYYTAKLKKDGTYCVVFYPNNTEVGTIKKVVDTLIFAPSSNVELSIKCLHDILNIVYMIKDNTPPELP